MLCECGCGETTKVSGKTASDRGYIKGQPLRFIHGHNGLGPNNGMWKEEGVTYSAYHKRVYQIRGKPHGCEFCGTKKATRFEWANMTGKYEDVFDFRSLCASCHRFYDARKRREAQDRDEQQEPESLRDA